MPTLFVIFRQECNRKDLEKNARFYYKRYIYFRESVIQFKYNLNFANILHKKETSILLYKFVFIFGSVKYLSKITFIQGKFWCTLHIYQRCYQQP